ncbi:hypothetical protein ACFOY8_11985 [Thalassospira xianhensis]|uniref:Uncharacterized protein n=1 Tax=Thalassospira xianhensis MCCC 1A02616 TaxID=1177929 RepID=A0A367U7E7_9PROT|nr:hypothetical protein [Thalassospira xianhensis]RCK04148.1 hypothetical protein TH5_21470 [Thalassospira xianhensis MCCC 1A02616]
MKLSHAQREFLDEVHEETSSNAPQWLSEDWFDPQFHRRTLLGLQRLELLEIQQHSDRSWEFRLTERGKKAALELG